MVYCTTYGLGARYGRKSSSSSLLVSRSPLSAYRIIRHNFNVLHRHPTSRYVSSSGIFQPNSGTSFVEKRPGARRTHEELAASSGMSSTSCDMFLHKHIGPSGHDITQMLQTVKANSLDDLVKEAIPANIRLNNGGSAVFESREDMETINVESMNEREAMSMLVDILSRNEVGIKNFIGQGFHPCYVPRVIENNIMMNPAWYSAYTPYQSEISQGRLESLFNFQTLISELTGLPIANASLLDEASAAAEAVGMAVRASRRRFADMRRRTSQLSAVPAEKPKDKLVVSSRVHQHVIDVVRTHCKPLGIDVVIEDLETLVEDSTEHVKLKNAFAVLVQYPDRYGTCRDITSLSESVHASGACLIVSADPLSLCILKPPADYAADIAIGTTQRFGVPMGGGGPHAAYLACTDDYIRDVPGRIIGLSKDSKGVAAYRMAYQTREQHVKRKSATSNICTAQVLLAHMAAFFAVYHGKEGLREMSERIFRHTSVLGHHVRKLGFELVEDQLFQQGHHFDTIAVKLRHHQLLELKKICSEHQVNLHFEDFTGIVCISLNETTTEKEVIQLENIFKQLARIAPTPRDLANITAGVAVPIEHPPSSVFREYNSPWLNHEVFNSHTKEPEFLRYLKALENKDITLANTMIPLGSCSMKLNSACSLAPLTWASNADIHPFQAPNQIRGTLRLVKELEDFLCQITGFDACSLQPNSGATGEYAGLLVIRQYYENESGRNICLVPTSAHGTNPASAHMCGYEVVDVPVDKDGLIDVSKLRSICEKYSNKLAVLMVTYPSTFGSFDNNIREICNIIHQHGGQVYMDGANMNAMLGLTSPAAIGADVCHVNLHKTFAIPHGGGGPGVGPICVKQHLAPFLPSHYVIQKHKQGYARSGIGSIVWSRNAKANPIVLTAAPFGSASILPISWLFIRLLGQHGLKMASQTAVLCANYMMVRLKDHYKVQFHDDVHLQRCAHEFIISTKDLQQKTDVTEEDICKRLMDFGFHAPTMSWPVQNSLMIEPTESESKSEMDRFIQALVVIRNEIEAIAQGSMDRVNNPLKNAPHTIRDLINSTDSNSKSNSVDEWIRPYSKETAVLPAPWLLERGKVFPSSNRIDNVYGDRHLICSKSSRLLVRGAEAPAPTPCCSM